VELVELVTLFSNEAAFKSAVETLLSEEIDDCFLDELDDKMIEASKENITQVEKLCNVLIELYEKYTRNFPLAYTYNTLLGCFSYGGDTARVLETLDSAIEHCTKVSAIQAGLSAIENTTNYIFSSDLPVEVKLSLIARCKDFYLKFELYEELVESHIAAAYLFSDHGAFQSAYRTLNDAEETAKDLNELRLFGRVVSTAVAVSLQEGDNKFAINTGLECIDFLETHGEHPPSEMLFNIGTAYQREDKPEKALEFYESCTEFGDKQLWEAQTKTNIAICKRKLGDIDGAISAASTARVILATLPEEHESLFELELVAANNFITASEHAEVLESLNRAVLHIEALVNGSVRLHYRRGVRERYVNRIEPMLRQLPSEGSAAPLYKLLALCRTSAASDWLHLLDWRDDALANDNIPDPLKERLTESVDAIKNFGAPFLYGFREKYDDPFGAGMPTLPWEEFTSLLVTLRESYGLPAPYETSSAEMGAELLKRRCEVEGSCCIISLKTALLFLHNGRYFIAHLDRENSKNFFGQLHMYRSGQRSLQEFAPVLAAISSSLGGAFDLAVNKLTLEGCQEIIFMPDQLECVPLVPSIMGNATLRAKVADGSLTFRVAPIFYEGKPDGAPLRTMVGISDGNSDLPLSASELENIAQIGQLKRLNPDGRTPDDLSEVDLVAITTHGNPITSFTDPIFSNLGGSDSDKNLYFETIQSNYVLAPYKLALLNSCYSGTSSAKNYFKQFSTHEMPSFPTLFLLNRRAAVIACEWRVIDKVAYIFSDTFFKEISKGLDIKQAYSNSISIISSLPGREAREVLSNRPGLASGDTSEPLPSAEYFDSMLPHPYCYGTFQLYTSWL
jgi:tetratricopeptide (TPR) repeat protein